MELLEKSVLILAKASGGNPALTTLVVFMFYVFFNLVESQVETLISGKRFDHWGDPIIGGLFIAYSAYAVFGCAIHNTTK